MFETILVPTDGAPLSDKAVRCAIRFAKEHGGKIVAISVAEHSPGTTVADMEEVYDANRHEERARKLASHFVKRIAEAAAAAKIPCVTHVAYSFNPYKDIINAAEQFNCDVIFMASHGRKGLSKLFVGSETQKVLAHSPVPVMVFR